MLKRFSGFVAIFASLFCVVVSNGTVHATSVYDGAYQRQTSGMYVQTPACSQVDITSDVNAQLASSSGWPAGPWYAPNQVRDYVQDMISGTAQGIIALTQMTYTDTSNNVSQYVAINPVQSPSQYLGWITDSSTNHQLRISTQPFYGTSQYGGQLLGFELDSSCNLLFHSIGGSAYSYISSDLTGQGMGYKSISLKTYGSPLPPLDYNLPTGYAGAAIGGITDADNDGLTSSQEMEQGTSDTNFDTDGDGISDYNESKLNPNYDDIYCDTSVSPHVCADPNPGVKDLFVEIDWMKNGSTEYKPTSAEITDLTNMYSAHGIRAHFDLGTYGGGSYLPVYSGNVNFWETSGALDIHDYKYGATSAETGTSSVAEQFSPYRQNIWRYMIFGASLVPDVEDYFHGVVGGVTETVGDDIIISSERSGLLDTAYYTNERAIAGLMAHELGHALCLSESRAYIDQESSCIFGGVDNDGYSSYISVMNTEDTEPSRSNLSTINYSSGSSTGDHDDWSAINAGMGQFIEGNQLDYTTLYRPSSKKRSKVPDTLQVIKGKAEDQRQRIVSKAHLAIPHRTFMPRNK